MTSEGEGGDGAGMEELGYIEDDPEEVPSTRIKQKANRMDISQPGGSASRCTPIVELKGALKLYILPFILNFSFCYRVDQCANPERPTD